MTPNAAAIRRPGEMAAPEAMLDTGTAFLIYLAGGT
jgi:hypothetical protein